MSTVWRASSGSGDLQHDAPHAGVKVCAIGEGIGARGRESGRAARRPPATAPVGRS